MGNFYSPNANPRYGQPVQFTPRSRLGKFSGPDPMIRTAGKHTVDIQLDDGDSYNLGGFAQGLYRLLWTDDADNGGSIEKYADFQVYIAENGDKSVKVMDTSPDTDTPLRHSADEDVVVVVPAVAGNIGFYVNGDDELVLTNGTGTGGVDGRVFELARLR